MKKAKQIKVDNRVRTVIECTLCGATTYVKAGINTKSSKAAIERSCGPCTLRNPLINQGWWLECGLSENRYVYGPMPRLRTGKHYRMEEARRMGWMAWTWNDEYSEQRKAITSQSLNR